MDLDILSSMKLDYACPIQEADFENLERRVSDSKDKFANYRFYRLDEILHDGKVPQREALQNFVSAMCVSGYNFVYIIKGDRKETRIYLGVSVSPGSEGLSSIGDYAHDILEASFQGMFRGSALHFLRNNEVRNEILEPLEASNYLSVAIGVPTLVDKRQKKEDTDFQGMDRLISAMHGENWMMIVVCEPVPRDKLGELQHNAYTIYEELVLKAKQSEQKSDSQGKGTSTSENKGTSKTVGTSKGTSKSNTVGTNTSSSHSDAVTNSTGTSKGETISASVTKGTSSGASITTGNSQGSSHTNGTSTTNSKGWSASKTESSSSGSSSNSHGSSRSTGDNGSQGGGTSKSDTTNQGTSSSEAKNTGKSKSETEGKSKNTNETINKGSSVTDQTSKGKSESTTIGSNDGESESSTTTNGVGTTISENTTQSYSVTKEIVNKKAAEVIKFLDEQLMPRLQCGINKGMFKTAVYLLSDYKSVNQRLCNNIKAIFQGETANFNPITTSSITTNKSWIQDFCIHEISTSANRPAAVLYGMTVGSKLEIATYLNSNEVSILAGIPLNEVPGVGLRQYIPFGLNMPKQIDAEDTFELGKLIYGGGALDSNPVYLEKEVLNRHAFVTGLTGSGKTMTCKQLLKASNSNFLVIEPAKTEYRELLKLEGMEDVIVYSIGNEKGLPLRFNPFELLPEENLTSHIDMIKAAFVSSLDFEASMPQILEIAIYQAYRKLGWDTEEGTNDKYNPEGDDGSVWPTLSDVLSELDNVVKDQKFGAELEGNYRGSLISRIKNLTYGAKGKMLDCRKSVDFSDLLHRKVVFELEELKSPQDKALIMAFIMARLAESVKLEFLKAKKAGKAFRHVSIIEEAHRLLTKAEPSDGEGKRYSITMFTDMLAEIRKYGESMIIVDQIPNKMAEDVLKNTATKIVHKIVAKDDKEAMGNTMMLSDEQKNFLSNLLPGCAVVFTEKWHKAAFIMVNLIQDVRSEKMANKLLRECREASMFRNRAAYYPELDMDISINDFMDYHNFGVKYVAVLRKLVCYWYKQNDTERTSNRTVLLGKINGFTPNEQEALIKGLIMTSNTKKIRNADEMGIQQLRKMVADLLNPAIGIADFEKNNEEGLHSFKVRR